MLRSARRSARSSLNQVAFRSFGEGDPAAGTSPSHGPEPGSGQRDRACVLWRRRRLLPPIEPRSRAPWIDARRRSKMLAEIQQHIRHRAPHLPWTTERAHMVAIGPDPTLPAGSPVDCLRGPDRQSPQSSPARGRRVGLGDQVNDDLTAPRNERCGMRRGLTDGWHPGQPARWSGAGVKVRPRQRAALRARAGERRVQRVVCAAALVDCRSACVPRPRACHPRSRGWASEAAWVGDVASSGRSRPDRGEVARKLRQLD